MTALVINICSIVALAFLIAAVIISSNTKAKVKHCVATVQGIVYDLDMHYDTYTDSNSIHTTDKMYARVYKANINGVEHTFKSNISTSNDKQIKDLGSAVIIHYNPLKLNEFYTDYDIKIGSNLCKVFYFVAAGMLIIEVILGTII